MRYPARLAEVGIVVLVAAAGCDRERGPAADAPAGRVPLNRPAETARDDLIARSLPRVAYQGGPFLRNPRIVTITFEGDDPPLVKKLERFGDVITRTDWWHTVVDGYCTDSGDCIGEGRPGRHVRLAKALPAEMDDAEVSALLEGEVEAGRLGSLDRDTLLVLYLPPAVAFRDALVDRYCPKGPRALHSALRLGNRTVPYAVIPRCGDFDQLTAAASHEIVEATTNPDPAARGFAFALSGATLGFTAAGVEPVDPCGLLTLDGHRFREGDFVVQRAWSNRAASLGRDPCRPSPEERPYAVLVPRTPTVRLAAEGDSTRVVLDATTDRPTGPWAVSAFDLTGDHDEEQYVDAYLDRSSVSKGEVATLTITLRKRSPPELVVVGVVSTVAGRPHVWPLAVTTR